MSASPFTPLSGVGATVYKLLKEENQPRPFLQLSYQKDHINNGASFGEEDTKFLDDIIWIVSSSVGAVTEIEDGVDGVDLIFLRTQRYP